MFFKVDKNKVCENSDSVIAATDTQTFSRHTASNEKEPGCKWIILLIVYWCSETSTVTFNWSGDVCHLLANVD